MCSQQNSKIMYILINNLGGFNLAHFEYSEMGKNGGGDKDTIIITQPATPSLRLLISNPPILHQDEVCA